MRDGTPKLNLEKEVFFWHTPVIMVLLNKCDKMKKAGHEFFQGGQYFQRLKMVMTRIMPIS